MTIVLGVLDDDGIVLAADTEETADDLKRDVSKFITFHNGHGSTIVVGGAGQASHTEAIASRLFEDCGDATANDGVALALRFRNIIKTFYKDHVLSWPSALEREDNDFSLIIGAALHKNKEKEKDSFDFKLWIAQKGVLRPVGDLASWGHDSVGTGKNYANALMDHYRGLAARGLSDDILVAIYVALRVKRDTPYCGKRTEVLWLNEHSCCFPKRKNFVETGNIVERAERLFGVVDELAVMQFWTMLSSRDDYLAGYNLRFLKKEFAKLLAEFPECMREIDDVPKLSASRKSKGRL